MYSEKVFETVYPQVVEKVINHILCFHHFKMLKETGLEKRFLLGERGCNNFFETQFLPVVESQR